MPEPRLGPRRYQCGPTPAGGTPEQTNTFFKSEATKWKRVIQIADIKPE